MTPHICFIFIPFHLGLTRETDDYNDIIIIKNIEMKIKVWKKYLSKVNFWGVGHFIWGKVHRKFICAMIQGIIISQIPEVFLVSCSKVH